MIVVTRTPCPPILNRNGPDWLTTLESARSRFDSETSDPTALERDKNQVKKQLKAAQGKYNHATIKKSLETMFNGGVESKETKCAYCETYIESKKAQDIEHFYPKSVYWRKTFEWENLLIACLTCNEEFKLDGFPLDVNGDPLLINPTTTDPADHLDFIFDFDTLDSHIEGKDEMGRITVDFFALNGIRLSDKKERGLAKNRNTSVSGWFAFALLIQQEPDPVKSQQLKAKLHQLCHFQTQYAAFARAIYAAIG